MEDILYKNSPSDIRIREMVDIKTKDPHNNYEYVDLDLPSGTKWAKMNVGAKSVTEHGLYFAWGEVIGYANADFSKKFTLDDYKFYSGGTINKYNNNDKKEVLESIDDAATLLMSDSWHIPTREDFDELIENTTNTWVENYLGSETCGLLFTSNINGQTLFIPASGEYDNSVNDYVNYHGYLWTKNLGGSFDVALYFYFLNGMYSYMGEDRSSGLTIRAITK